MKEVHQHLTKSKLKKKIVDYDKTLQLKTQCEVDIVLLLYRQSSAWWTCSDATPGQMLEKPFLKLL